MPTTYGPYISKVTLPSGNTYDLKDEEARELIHELQSTGSYLGITTSNISEGSTINPIVIDGTNVTAHNGDWCLHEETRTVGQQSVTSNIAYIFNSSNKWQEFSDMTNLGGLAYKDSASGTVNDYVTGVASASATVKSKTLKFTPAGTNAPSSVSFTPPTTDDVLGKDTTFTNSSSSVSFGTHTTATVLKSSVTATVPKTSSTPKYLTKDTAITGLGTPSTEEFVQSYPGTTSKLSTTTVTGVSGSTTASKATAGTAVAVAKAGTAATVASGNLGTETSTQGANTPMWGATVTNETLSFTFKPLSTTSVTPAVSNGSITPYTFADVTVPKAATSATTVATGSLAANGGGASVMTGLGTATTKNAVTGYASPTTKKFVDGTSASSGTDTITYVESVGTSGTDSVTFATSGNTAKAIIALGAGTAAAQDITVGTNDIVAAITALGEGTAAAQIFSGTEGDISHNHSATASVTLETGNKTFTVS